MSWAGSRLIINLQPILFFTLRGGRVGSRSQCQFNSKNSVLGMNVFQKLFTSLLPKVFDSLNLHLPQSL